jgi:hypothetical protein
LAIVRSTFHHDACARAGWGTSLQWPMSAVGTSDALITTEKVGSLALSGRAHNGREPAR